MASNRIPFGRMYRIPAADEYLMRHMRESGRVELRAIDPHGRVSNGLFDCLMSLQGAIREYRDRANLYTTIQSPKPQHASNRMIARGRGIANADIGHRIRIPFDLDAERATGSQATDDEVEATIDTALDVRRFMGRFDWPLPAMVMSGNGVHLIYRTAPIPHTAEMDALLKAIYTGLSLEFSNGAVKFDTTVRNAGRILRLPGSLNFKGDPNAPREVTIKMPSRYRQVQPRHIEALARIYRDIEPPQQLSTGSQSIGEKRHSFSGEGDYNSLDVVAWFTAHSHYVRPIEANKHAVCCPWQTSHSSDSSPTHSDAIIFEADHSWPGFFCHHVHCVERDIRDVLSVWGDADQFCARRFERGRRR